MLNAPEETVIATAVEGLAIGQCTAHFPKNYPTSIRELFEVMRQYARSDDDLKKRKVTQNSWTQAVRAPWPPLTPTQQNIKPFRAINNLQEQPKRSLAEQGFQAPPPNQQYKSFNQGQRGGQGGRGPHRGRDGRGRGKSQRKPYYAVCGENAGHFTQDYKCNKMAKELKEKDEAVKSSETSNHMFHNTNRKMANNQGYGSPYKATSSSTPQYPSTGITSTHTSGSNRHFRCISISHNIQGIQQLCPHQFSKNSNNQANHRPQSKKVPRSTRS